MSLAPRSVFAADQPISSRNRFGQSTGDAGNGKRFNHLEVVAWDELGLSAPGF
jgi:hypothetical protein